MILKKGLSIAALALACGFGITACDDDEVPKEPVVAVPEEVPAPPPSAAATAAANAAALAAATKAVYFAFDDYTLNKEGQETLNTLGEVMKKSTSTVVQIEGHCDERGSIEYNLALGQRRAQSVKNYLVQLGLDPARLPTISFGEEKPAVKGTGEAVWSKNRRAEFVVSTP